MGLSLLRSLFSLDPLIPRGCSSQHSWERWCWNISLAFDLSREYPPLQGPTSQMSFLFHGLPLKPPLVPEAVIVCFQLHGSQSILDLAIVRCLNSYSFLDR